MNQQKVEFDFLGILVAFCLFGGLFSINSGLYLEKHIWTEVGVTNCPDQEHCLTVIDCFVSMLRMIAMMLKSCAD